ncbi:MAG: hypothetical protein AB1689_23825 [Thermodesulfobacteriota bacterium]
MPRRATTALAVLLLLASVRAEPARGQSGCMLDGRHYPENAVICSGGIVTYCSNGVWQSNDGQRCDVRSGAYLSPLRPFEERNREEIPEYYREKYPELGLQ